AEGEGVGAEGRDPPPVAAARHRGAVARDGRREGRLRRRVGALRVGGRVGLGVAERLGLGHGLPPEQAVAEAQSLGYAEADPTADAEGPDAAAKAALPAAIARDRPAVTGGGDRGGVPTLRADALPLG